MVHNSRRRRRHMSCPGSWSGWAARNCRARASTCCWVVKWASRAAVAASRPRSTSCGRMPTPPRPLSPCPRSSRHSVFRSGAISSRGSWRTAMLSLTTTISDFSISTTLLRSLFSLYISLILTFPLILFSSVFRT